MDKGIRPYCNAKFMELLPTRTNSREGNVRFRKDVMGAVMEAFGASIASAATHYNHSFIQARANPDVAIQALLVGLGRPEDKKGGRKPKVKVEAVAAPAPEAAPEAPATEGETAQAAPTPEVGVDENLEAVQEMLDSQPPRAWPFPDAITKVTVTRKRDGVVVGEFTIVEAEKLVAAAKAGKKAALEYEVPTHIEQQEVAVEAAQ